VPIDVNKCDEFDLDKVPTLDILIEQLSSLNSSEKEKKIWEQTSLVDSMIIFKRFLTKLQISLHKQQAQSRSNPLNI